MAIPFPSVDPVLVHLGPLSIRWYSLAYIGGIVLGWMVVKRELARRPLSGLTPTRIDDLIVWAIGGILIGGRLGYTLIYKADYYFEHPAHILRLWEGGMSFHGGFAGFILAFFLFCRRYNIPYLSLMDLMACVAPIGIGFGRLANFVNGELWGRVSDVPWAMVFPNGGDLPRHPSQLYEALLEGGMLLAIMLALLHCTRLRDKPGTLSGMFLIGYAVARMVSECFREPDAQIGFLWAGATMGQLLSVPMMLAGLFLIFRPRRV